MKTRIALVLTAALLIAAGTAVGQEWQLYNTDNSGIVDNAVRSISIDNLGTKWIGTATGLNSFDGVEWKTYTDADKLANNSVNDIAFEITSYGPEIWVATDGGVSVVSVVPDAVTFATPYTSDNTGLINNRVTSAAVDANGVKWFGTDGGLSLFSGSEWTSYDELTLLSKNEILSIAVSANGWVYMGTDGAGVSRFDGVTSASPIDTDWSGIASDKVTAAYITADGTQWFGTDKGFSKHEGTETKENWTTWTTGEGLAGNYVYDIAEDSKGVLWIGTDGGISSYDGEMKKIELPEAVMVYSITIDDYDHFWLGTDKGMAFYNPYETAVEDEEEMPVALSLSGVYPNPFNPSATIEFNLAESGTVELSVYNLAGQKVRSLVEDTRAAGVHGVVWDGCDEFGNRVSSGVYIARLSMGNTVSTTSMTLVK